MSQMPKSSYSSISSIYLRKGDGWWCWFTRFKSPMLTLRSDGPCQIRRSFLRDYLLAELLSSASMHLCDVGEEPGPHLFQVSFRLFFFFRADKRLEEQKSSNNNNNDISVDPLSWVSKGKKRAAEDNNKWKTTGCRLMRFFAPCRQHRQNFARNGVSSSSILYIL